jgi:hypothetical protein
MPNKLEFFTVEDKTTDSLTPALYIYVCTQSIFFIAMALRSVRIAM